MYKIRKKIFLFLAFFLLIFTAAVPLHFVSRADAAGEDVSLPLIDGNKTEYADCFSVSDGVLSGFSLPEGVTGFYSVIIPDSVKTIENNVFAGKRIQSLTVPSSVITIGASAFSGCSALSSVEIAEGDAPLTISGNAFERCWALEGIEIPARCDTIGDNAFKDSGLKWAYLHSADCLNEFKPFGNATLVFKNKADYDRAVSDRYAAENDTFLVTVEFYLSGETPVFTRTKLYNHSYSFEYTDMKVWEQNAGITDLPAQHESYLSTVWYSDKALKTVAALADVNTMLSSQDKPTEIKLYAHATVTPPSVEQAVTLVFGKESILPDNGTQMAGLLGIDENAGYVYSARNAGGLPVDDLNKEAGKYLVTVSLNGNYGVWKSAPTSTFILTPNDAVTMRLMLIVLAIVSLVAVALTVSLVLVRVGATKKKKRRELTSEEVIDKFIASGGRTRLKK